MSASCFFIEPSVRKGTRVPNVSDFSQRELLEKIFPTHFIGTTVRARFNRNLLHFWQSQELERTVVKLLRNQRGVFLKFNDLQAGKDLHVISP
jgi:hypothetical protein